MFGRHCDIGLAPPHRVFGFGIAHEIFVVRRSAGVLASGDDQGPILGQNPFPVDQRLFVKRCRGQIPMDCALGRNALVGKRKTGGTIGHDTHS